MCNQLDIWISFFRGLLSLFYQLLNLLTALVTDFLIELMAVSLCGGFAALFATLSTDLLIEFVAMGLSSSFATSSSGLAYAHVAIVLLCHLAHLPSSDLGLRVADFMPIGRSVRYRQSEIRNRKAAIPSNS